MTLRLLYLFFCQWLDQERDLNRLLVRDLARFPDLLARRRDDEIQRSYRVVSQWLTTQAGAAHFLYVSIVGVQASRIPYSRVKAAAEDLVRQAELAWSIVPATEFYWLLGRFLDNLADRRIWPLPANLPMQPVASTDFAAYVGECVAAGPGAEREASAGRRS